MSELTRKEAMVVKREVKPRLETYLSELDDPRESMNQGHKFIDILVIAICAGICGAS